MRARASTNVLFLFFGLKALEYAWIYSFRARRREERRELTFASGASLSRGGRVFSLLFFLRTQNAVCLFFEGNFYTHPPRGAFQKKKTEPKCASVETRANEKNETRRRRTSRRTFFCAKKKSSSWKETSFARAVFVHAFSMERTFPYRKRYLFWREKKSSLGFGFFS